MNQAIIKAIKEKRCLSFMYDNHPRVVEPHCYGITRKEKEAIRCYQIRGTGKRLNESPWHLMTLDKIMSLQLLEETFDKPRHGYNKGDEHMIKILCEL
ncbi:MAG: hypothetical protein Q7T53_10000 [Deltaproteobacteria bacterium]|nr:hypothetical protein [Deltaproteobacteria bacterium]